MLGVLESHRLGDELNDPTAEHHRDVRRDVPDNVQVVADEQHRKSELLPQIDEQIQDLRLDRDVQGTHGFVRDE